ncbi:hypothetical protein EVAR_32394_1 [Eumeta japonica]|uniref:Uncharacterized protein n=1 Tax=Eumeta variegata TaxID=151549 RepID=A0A4C1VIF8_EUMVA|nr:hypothetical protein EVAR_32394_1 [Eumeta japonica]
MNHQSEDDSGRWVTRSRERRAREQRMKRTFGIIYGGCLFYADLGLFQHHSHTGTSVRQWAVRNKRPSSENNIIDCGDAQRRQRSRRERPVNISIFSCKTENLARDLAPADARRTRLNAFPHFHANRHSRLYPPAAASSFSAAMSPEKDCIFRREGRSISPFSAERGRERTLDTTDDTRVTVFAYSIQSQLVSRTRASGRFSR